MAVLNDKALSEVFAGAVVGGPTPTPWKDAVAIERDYLAHRGAVLAMLRAEFPRLRESEELYQEAWAELLELRARGETVRNVRALLKKIAWRRAADLVRRQRTDAVDPSSPILAFTPDPAPLPDDQAQLRLDADALRLVIESLDPRQAAVLKLRFDLHLSAREIQQRLGVSPKRLEKIVTEAYKQVLEQLDGTGDESRWVRRQRSLLLACEVGIASPRQRRRAQDMVRRDARCRAMLREMRAALRDVAAVLPVPVVLDEERHLRPVEMVFGRLDEFFSSTRQLQHELANRGIPTSGALEQAGVGGAAVGAGATAKIVAMCVAAGGTVALCIGGARLLEDERPRGAPPPSAMAVRVIEPPRQRVQTVRAVHAPARLQRRVERRQPAPQAKPERPVSSPGSSASPSPAAGGSTEFGPGTGGSSSAPTRPAASPANGGGEFTP